MGTAVKVTVLLILSLLGTTFSNINVGELSNDFYLSSLDRFEEVGALHTKAFEMLGDMYASKRPENRTEMMSSIHDIVASFCDDEDNACRSQVEDRASRREPWEDEDNNNNGEDNIDYPDDFDPKLLQSMENMYSTLQRLTPHRKNDSSDYRINVQDILDKLADIQADIKKLFMVGNEFGVTSYSNSTHSDDEMNPIHLMAALSGISVAIESTKLWTAVYADKNHPLYGLHHPNYYDATANLNNKTDPDNVRGRRALQFSAPNIDTVLQVYPSGGLYNDDHHEDDHHYDDDDDDDDNNNHIQNCYHNLYHSIIRHIHNAISLSFLVVGFGAKIVAFVAAKLFLLTFGLGYVLFRLVFADIRGAFIGVFQYYYDNPSQPFNVGGVITGAFAGSAKYSAGFLIPIFQDYRP